MHLFDQLFRKSEEPLWFETENGREGAFNAVALSDGKRIPVMGTKIAREGLAFVSNVELHGTDVPLTFTIRRRTIPSRVRIIKDDHIKAAARTIHRYLCSFTTIAADDWDAVGRYVEADPHALPVIRETLTPVEDELWAEADDVLGEPARWAEVGGSWGGRALHALRACIPSSS